MHRPAIDWPLVVRDLNLNVVLLMSYSLMHQSVLAAAS